MIGVILAGCFLTSPAVGGAATKSASDIAPIVGKWNDGSAVINVVGGGGSFAGTVVSGSFGACDTKGVVWKGLTGGGFSYSGQIPFVNSDDCSSAGDGPATFTLSDINHGTWSATSPGDGMTYSGSMTRVGTWPGAAGGDKPKTNCKKNGERVLCPGQKKTVKKVVKQAKKTVKATNGFKKASVEKQSNKLGKLTALSVQAGKTAAEWREQKLPKTRAQAKAKYGGPGLAKAWNFEKAISDFNSKIAAIGDRLYANPDARATLDATAFDLYRAAGYSQLSTNEKAGTYSKSWRVGGGNALRVDPQTGNIVFQLYGSASQTDYAVYGENACPSCG